ncbi:MAG: chitobiase/beta-hexosaminidase C-terminal domain-containing protein [Fibrobacteres bacterium]|jgi:uncharacterized protein (TIGR02145 family)|nr:chitobiase/beta-hexosaminidase C-terminal domain-containing protein [Fibrobacterota bacterium]
MNRKTASAYFFLGLVLVSCVNPRVITGNGDEVKATSVLPVQITPSSGSYASVQALKLVTATPGATILYTFDSAPVPAAWMPYTAQIPIKRGMTIRAIAMLAGLENSPEARAVYKISNDPGSGAIPWNSSISYGTLIDPRDSKEYRTMQIGAQTWMAENLNFRSGGSFAYNGSADSATKYGLLYLWTPEGSSLCPVGWHVPTAEEWNFAITLAKYDQRGVGDFATINFKSTNGWISYDDANSGGVDAFGFRALPAGSYGPLSSGDIYATLGYSEVGYAGSFWTTSSRNDADGIAKKFDSYGVSNWYGSKSKYACSVRCIQN